MLNVRHIASGSSNNNMVTKTYKVNTLEKAMLKVKEKKKKNFRTLVSTK